MRPFVEDLNDLAHDLLGPLHLPHHPVKVARFGFYGIRSARGLAHSAFKEEPARALFAGLAAHSFLSLDRYATSAFALVLATLAHVIGWPIARGGSQKITYA